MAFVILSASTSLVEKLISGHSKLGSSVFTIEGAGASLFVEVIKGPVMACCKREGFGTDDEIKIVAGWDAVGPPGSVGDVDAASVEFEDKLASLDFSEVVARSTSCLRDCPRELRARVDNEGPVLLPRLKVVFDDEGY